MHQTPPFTNQFVVLELSALTLLISIDSIFEHLAYKHWADGVVVTIVTLFHLRISLFNQRGRRNGENIQLMSQRTSNWLFDKPLWSRQQLILSWTFETPLWRIHPFLLSKKIYSLSSYSHDSKGSLFWSSLAYPRQWPASKVHSGTTHKLTCNCSWLYVTDCIDYLTLEVALVYPTIWQCHRLPLNPHFPHWVPCFISRLVSGNSGTNRCCDPKDPRGKRLSKSGRWSCWSCRPGGHGLVGTPRPGGLHPLPARGREVPLSKGQA